MKRRLIYLLTFLISFNLYATGVDSVAIKYSEEITSEKLSEYLHKLASDEFEGRETGKKGQKMAAGYIAKHFKMSGIPPYKDTTYYQTFPLIVQSPGGAEISIKNEKFHFLKDFYFFPGFADQKIQAESVVLAGFGIADEKYDNFKNTDVKGKIVVAFEGEPTGKDGKCLLSKDSVPSDWTTNWRLKSETAKEKGAFALFIVLRDIERNINKSKHFIEKPTVKLIKGEKADPGFPVFYISERMAKKILGKKPEKLKQKFNLPAPTQSFEINAKIEIDINRPKETLYGENVLGFVEGSDLKDELIIITAHYDHLGKADKTIYYGADDDGSGTAAVMELARTFAKAKKEGHGPRRSILFMPVSGEEKGLLGSEYYTSNPVYPLKNTVADLNIDMIGRIDKKHSDGNYIYVIGSDKLSTDLHKISEEANKKYTSLDLDYTYNNPNDPNRFYYRSDHYNFVKNNIPVIFYFNGTHADYHKPTDTVDKIDFKKMEKISRLVFFTAWDLANRTSRIKVDVKPELKAR